VSLWDNIIIAAGWEEQICFAGGKSMKGC